MKRRNFIGLIGGTTALSALSPIWMESRAATRSLKYTNEMKADLVIAGGGLGGCAAALAALRNGLSVILTEETDWLGGQLTQQGVPPDEHQWVESHGCTRLYRELRQGIRDYYRQHYPLSDSARANVNLNPGSGFVSRLCHEPRVALAVLFQLFSPYISSGKIQILLEHQAIKAEKTANRVQAMFFENLKTGKKITCTAPYFVDATELGDLLPLTGTAYVKGTESRSETEELHAPAIANPENQQAFTQCFAMDYLKDANLIIDKPKFYDFWKKYVPKISPAWPGPLLDLTYSTPSTLVPKKLGFHPEGIDTGEQLNMWNYRRIIAKDNFKPGFYDSDVTIVNWPQNDYLLGNLIDVSPQQFNRHTQQAKELSLSLFYWLQTEVPRPDGGQGWPGLRLRGDILGSADGMAKYPYIRESRRIRALFTVKEEHVGRDNRALITGKPVNNAAKFGDSVGIGYYHIDLHPSTRGNNYIDFPSLPFQIPLGALIPQDTENLLPANKNIGTTHITNGCYRLHPVEWNIGESVGMLVTYALKKQLPPRSIREDGKLLSEFQEFIQSQGIEISWPENTNP